MFKFKLLLLFHLASAVIIVIVIAVEVVVVVVGVVGVVAVVAGVAFMGPYKKENRNFWPLVNFAK